MGGPLSYMQSRCNFLNFKSDFFSGPIDALTIEGRALGRALLSPTGWANRRAGRLEEV